MVPANCVPEVMKGWGKVDQGVTPLLTTRKSLPEGVQLPIAVPAPPPKSKGRQSNRNLSTVQSQSKPQTPPSTTETIEESIKVSPSPESKSRQSNRILSQNKTQKPPSTKQPGHQSIIAPSGSHIVSEIRKVSKKLVFSVMKEESQMGEVSTGIEGLCKEKASAEEVNEELESRRKDSKTT